MKKYKTVHENRNDLEQFNKPKEVLIKLPEKINMEGIQEFLNKKLNTNPYSIQQQVKDQLQDLKGKFIKLERYKSTTNGDMVESPLFGEYIKLEDVINLFGREKIK